MKKFKHLLSLTLITTLSLSMFAGCGKEKATSSNQSDSNEPVVIKYWSAGGKSSADWYKKKFADYEASHPNVKIEWTSIPFDAITEKIIASTVSGDVPDVVQLNTSFASQLAAKGILLDLNKEATKNQKEIYYENLLNSTKLKGGIYGFPWYGAPEILIINKDLLAKAGLDFEKNTPKNEEELLALAKDAKDKSGTYLYIPNTMNSLLIKNGYQLLNKEKNKAAFNTPEIEAFCEKYKKLYDDGYLPKGIKGDWDKLIQYYSTEKVAVISSGPQTIRRIKEEAPNMLDKTIILPSIPGKDNHVMSPLMVMSVMKKSKHQKEAVDFANFLTNDENQLEYSLLKFVLPSTKKASTDDKISKGENDLLGKALSIASKELPNSIDICLGVENQDQLLSALEVELDAAFTGQKTVKQALETAEKKWNEVLAKQ